MNREAAIEKVLSEMNGAMSSAFTNDMFVAYVKVKAIEYYYDSDSDKIKVKTKVTYDGNAEVFSNENVQGCFDCFLQILANEINDTLANDEALEQCINKLVSSKA